MCSFLLASLRRCLLLCAISSISLSAYAKKQNYKPTTQRSHTSSLLPAWIVQAAKQVEQDVITWRHHIHAHPELGNYETETARFVADKLRSFANIAVREKVAKTGVVGVLIGALPGHVVALRADMDALPVEKMTQLPFASKAQGLYFGKKVSVMHACGHDAHTAMLLGAAKVLSQHRDKLAGTIVFIFQPAEEGPADISPFNEYAPSSGAKRMVEEGVLDSPRVEAVFGLHVMAGIASGEVQYKTGVMLGSFDEFQIKIQGRQAHGSMPWLSIRSYYNRRTGD